MLYLKTMNAIFKSFLTEAYEFQNKRNADEMMADIRKFCMIIRVFMIKTFCPTTTKKLISLNLKDYSTQAAKEQQ